MQLPQSLLDCLSANIAILDEAGTIVAVNQQWSAFAEANGVAPAAAGQGGNYLSVCDAILGQYSEEGRLAAAGIRAVIAMQASEFAIEYACHARNEERWFLMRATPILGVSPRLFMVTHENITRRKELEREVVEIASFEQQRIGQDLHDECGQQLTAIGLLADSLADLLAKDSPAAIVADKIKQTSRTLLRQLRNISRELVAAELTPAELDSALTDLVYRLNEASDVRCIFRGAADVAVEDNLRATQLYHIAQEACTNALKHSQAKHIEVLLRSTEHGLVLQIQDDGTGIPKSAVEGLGMRIMRNRARMIGARLSVENMEPSGALVICNLRGRADVS